MRIVFRMLIVFFYLQASCVLANNEIHEIEKTKKTMASARQLIKNNQFQGAAICGFSSQQLGKIKASGDHSENAFNIGLSEGFSNPEVMIAVAMILNTYETRASAYVDGYLEAVDQNKSYKQAIVKKLIKSWLDSNNCEKARSTKKY